MGIIDTIIFDIGDPLSSLSPINYDEFENAIAGKDILAVEPIDSPLIDGIILYCADSERKLTVLQLYCTDPSDASENPLEFYGAEFDYYIPE